MPKAHLQFAETGLEFMVRYPVEIPHAAEIDDEMTRKLMEVDRRESGVEDRCGRLAHAACADQGMNALQT